MSSAGVSFRSAGAAVTVDSEVPGVLAAARDLTAGAVDAAPAADPDVHVVVERRDPRPRTADLVPVTRGVWYGGHGEVVLDSAGGSGFAQVWSTDGDRVSVRAGWAPSAAESVAARALSSRFRALRAQVLLHYPALWWAALHGLAPLHVSALELDGVTVLLAGPGGVGKSSLVARELETGASATCDNLAASDGHTAFGVLEPLRLPARPGDGPAGARATHGRRELAWHGHVPQLTPDLLVVVRRGDAEQETVRPLDGDLAARALVAGTFAAGELRRFWSLCAVLGLATGRGPVVPPVEAVARTLAERLPCYELELARTPGRSLYSLIAEQVAAAYVPGPRR